MPVFAAIPLTCWLCAVLAAPRRALPGREIEQCVYARLLGRQQRLMLLALLQTGVALLALVADLPPRVDPDLRALREARISCTYPVAGGPTCHILQLGGVWAYAEVHADGSWRVVSTATVPIIETNPFDDPRATLR